MPNVPGPEILEGAHGYQFNKYSLSHPANLKPQYRKKKGAESKQSAFANQYKKMQLANQNITQVNNMIPQSMMSPPSTNYSMMPTY